MKRKNRVSAKARASVHNVVKVVVGEIKKRRKARRRRRSSTPSSSSSSSKGFNQSVRDEVERQVSLMRQPTASHLSTGYNLFSKLAEREHEKLKNTADSLKQTAGLLDAVLPRSTLTLGDYARAHMPEEKETRTISTNTSTSTPGKRMRISKEEMLEYLLKYRTLIPSKTFGYYTEERLRGLKSTDQIKNLYRKTQKVVDDQVGDEGGINLFSIEEGDEEEAS